MAKSLTEIQRDSDAKRGVKQKSFKIKIEDAAYIDDVAKKFGMSNNALLMAAIRYYDQNHTPK